MESCMQEVDAQVAELRAAHANNDVDKCKSLLSQIKRKLITFQLLPPFHENPAVAKKQLHLARTALELGALVSLKAKDIDSFSRHIAQVKPYYDDYADLLPEAESKWMIIGLNLLGLLAQNRIAEFHTELELIPQAVIQGTPSIAFLVELEQWLMEGSYSKVLKASKTATDPGFEFFMGMLTDMLRDKIMDCSQTAYETMPAADACRLLLLSNEQELKEYAGKRGWVLRDGLVDFNQDKGEAMSIPSLKVIGQTVSYATEMERIV